MSLKSKLIINNNDIILITGGNGDLAFSLINNFANNHNLKNIKIISLDINQNNINKIYNRLENTNIEFILYKIDISDLKILKETLENIKIKYGIPKIIINNAAIANWNFINKNFNNFKNEIYINAISHIYIIKYFLPDMINLKNIEFSICNICSVVGIIPGIKTSGYSSSKFLMNGFHLNLRLDLKKLNINNINTNIIYPYLFASKLFSNLNNNSFLHKYIIPKLSIDYVGEKVYNSIIHKVEEKIIPYKLYLANKLFLILPSYLKDYIWISLSDNLFN